MGNSKIVSINSFLRNFTLIRFKWKTQKRVDALMYCMMHCIT